MSKSTIGQVSPGAQADAVHSSVQRFRTTSLMAWTADQERQAASRRTKAGLEKAVAEGKTLGPPRKVNEDQIEEMARLKRAGLSYRTIGRRMVPNVSGDTVMRKLRERQG